MPVDPQMPFELNVGAAGSLGGSPLRQTQDATQGIPPGEGTWTVPQFTTFASIVNSISRTYRYTHDEALKHSRENALAVRRDPVIMDALRSRQIPVAQLPWHIEAEDEQDTRQADAAQSIEKALEATPRFQQLKMHANEAIFYGRYGVQLKWGWDFSTGKKRLLVKDHVPVNGDKLRFKYSGQVGVLVHSSYKGTTEPTDSGRCHFFTPQERECYVVHRYEPEDTDFYEGELAGGIHGVGIRSRIYWFWYMRSQVTTWLLDYLERVGAGGFTVYFYEAGNPESLAEVKAAAEEQHKNNTVLFPRYKDGTTGGPGIQRVEPSQAGAQLLQALITNYFDEVIRRYILGQNLTSQTAGTGLGSGVADLHADTFARLVKYDAVALAETLTTDLVAVMQRYMYPGIPPLRFVFDVDKPNASDVLEAASAFWQMGGTLDEAELRSTIGLAPPQPGHAILSKMGSMQPAALGGVPQGVPVMGQAGMGGANLADPNGGGGMDPAMFNALMQGGGPQQFSRRGRRRRYSKIDTDPRLLDMVRAYLADRKMPDYRGEEYHPLYQPLSRRIADYYQQAPHSPQDPAVRAAYEAMTGETLDQFRHAQKAGVKFEPWTRPGQPYKDSREMRDDALGGHLFYYTGGDFPEDNLIAQPAGVEVAGRPHTHNDIFRAVHDFYGHALHGNEFGPRGEEHAWRTHSKMYSPQARPAMGFETRGQNSWVNFGPHLRRSDGSIPHKGEQDWIHPARRPYAPQKNNVLAPELME